MKLQSFASRRVYTVVTCVLLTALGVCGLTPPLLAENGRDFSAMYDITHVTPIDASRVSLVLALKLQNHSGADITDARISILDGGPIPKSLGAFPQHVTVANHASMRISAKLTVPATYLTRWKGGPGPKVAIKFVNARGKAISWPVELIRMPGVGG